MKTILISIFLLLSIYCDAQIGHYYKNVQKNYSNTIIVSDANTITTRDNGYFCAYFFDDVGICNRIAMQWDGETHASLRAMLIKNKNLTWSSTNKHWFTTIKGSDGNEYFVITTIESDKKYEPYVNIRISYKIILN